jgi:hypothetical protein
MAFQGNHYVVTYDDGNNTNTTKLDVFAKDDTDARNKVLIMFPSAKNIVVSSAL